MKPLARSDGLVIEEVFDELVIYDLERDRVHSLNPTAAFVWHRCNGQHTTDELVALLQREFRVSQAETLLWSTLDRLEKAHLLHGKVPYPSGTQKTYTRREMLKMAGRGAGLTVAMLPVIKSIVAPSVAQAASDDTGGCTSCGGPASHPLGFGICCCQKGTRIRCMTVSRCERIGGKCVGRGSRSDRGEDDDGDE